MNAPPARRPVLVTLAVVLVAISGLSNTTVGVLLLLSRYDVPVDEVLTVSLLGVGVVLFGLLTLAIASGIARGSRLSRLLLTLYLVAQVVLHVIVVITNDTWDVAGIVQIVVAAGLVTLVWSPRGSQYFRSRVPAPDPYAP